MTTSFAYAAHLQPWQSIRTQPLGFLLAVGAAALFWVSLHTAATGSHLARICARMLTPRSLWALAALLALSWAYTWATWT